MSILPWAGPVFAAGMAVYFMQWDSIIRNVIYAVPEGILLYSVIKVLTERRVSGKRLMFPWNVLFFCMMEYGMWLSSCIWVEDSLSNPYYWFDFLVTVSYLFFLPATEKAVAE